MLVGKKISQKSPIDYINHKIPRKMNQAFNCQNTRSHAELIRKPDPRGVTSNPNIGRKNNYYNAPYAVGRPKTGRIQGGGAKVFIRSDKPNEPLYPSVSAGMRIRDEMPQKTAKERYTNRAPTGYIGSYSMSPDRYHTPSYADNPNNSNLMSVRGGTGDNFNICGQKVKANPRPSLNRPKSQRLASYLRGS